MRLVEVEEETSMNPQEATEEYIEVRNYENPSKSTINNYPYRFDRFSGSYNST